MKKRSTGKLSRLWKGALASAWLAASCGAPHSSTPFDPNGFDGLAHEDFGLLNGTCSYDSSGNMTAIVADGEAAYLTVRATDGMVVLNANDGNSVQCAVAATKTIKINSAGADPANATRKLVLDYYNGQFALGSKTAVGLTLAWAAAGTGSNTLEIRGTNGVDQYYFGTLGFNVNAATDQFPDVSLTNVTAIIASTGGGNDVLNADGGKGTGNSCTIPVTFWGGANDDTLVGGVGGTPTVTNVLNGGSGNDTFTQTASMGTDQIVGGAGTDTVDYSTRTLAISVTLGDGTANDGDVAAHSNAGEQDEVMEDIENVLGGAGNDVIDASSSADLNLAHAFTGNNGADKLVGAKGADTLDGGAGDDTLMGGLGNDTMIGGAGIDTVDYSDRASGHAVVVSLVYASSATQNGETGEVDIFNNSSKGPDIENLRGGADDDTLTGNSVANIIWGGAGDDTISGGNGNDTLYGDDGDDILNGYDGTGAGAVATDDDTLIGGLGADTFKGDGGNNLIDSNDGVADTLIDCGSGNSPLLVSDAADVAASGVIQTNCNFQ